MGFAAASDADCLQGDMALHGVQNCVKVEDDILLYDMDFPTHLQRIHDTLTRGSKFLITHNRDKFVVAPSCVAFCGYQLSADPSKVTAIRDFPTPTNLTDLRSFMGEISQPVG